MHGHHMMMKPDPRLGKIIVGCLLTLSVFFGCSALLLVATGILIRSIGGF